MAIDDRRSRPTIGTIVLVEDEADVRSVLAEHLGDAGYRVVEVEDGRDALPAVEASRPDVILLDIMLPGWDGIEILRRVRAFDPTVGVVMVTAIEDEELAGLSLQLGAVDYIRKPFELDHVDRVVLSALGWVSEQRR